MADIKAKAAPYFEMARQAATKEGIRPELLLGLLAQESGFNPNARSGAGALGIAQFMPATAKEYGINPLDPQQAVPAAAHYLKKGMDKYGSEELALAAYNSGFGNVDKHKGIPPFRETQKYVPAILSLAKQFGGDPQAMTSIQQAPQFQQQTQPAPQSGYSIDPRILAGAPPTKMGGGLSTLLAVLGGLGALGGTAANVIGGIKGTGSPGDAALAQSSSIFGHLGKQQQAMQDYQNKQQILQGMPPEVAAQYALGGGDAAARFMAENTPSKQRARDVDAQIKQNTLDGYESPEQKRQNNLRYDLAKEDRQFKNQMKIMETRAGIKTEDPVQKAKLVMDFQNQALKREPIKQMMESGSFVNSMNAIWNDYRSGASQLGGKNALTQTLISGFGKINDPGSVVRESEYARTPEGQALADKLPGLLEKAKVGGAGLVDAELQDLVTAANIIQESRVRSAKPLIDSLYSTAGKAGITPEEILPVDDTTKGFLIKSSFGEGVQKVNSKARTNAAPAGGLSAQELEEYKMLKEKAGK